MEKTSEETKHITLTVTLDPEFDGFGDLFSATGHGTGMADTFLPDSGDCMGDGHGAGKGRGWGQGDGDGAGLGSGTAYGSGDSWGIGRSDGQSYGDGSG